MISGNITDRSNYLRIDRYGEIGNGEWGYQLIHGYTSNGDSRIVRKERAVREVHARVKDKDYILEDVRADIMRDEKILELAGSFRHIGLDESERANSEMRARIEKEAQIYMNRILGLSLEIQDNTSIKSERIIRREF